MRVSREQAIRNRERVLEVAGRLFRERGFDGVGVDAVMAGAGLTHGGFYKSFGSKEDLMAEVTRSVLDQASEHWRARREAGEDAIRRVVDEYLSRRHVDARADGCPFAALAGEVGRREPSVRRAFTEGFRTALDQMTRLMPGRAEARRRERAIATLASLVGGVVLARAVDGPDLADEILAAVRNAIPSAPAPAGRATTPEA